MLALISNGDSETIALQDGLKARRCKCLFFSPDSTLTLLSQLSNVMPIIMNGLNPGFDPQEVTSLTGCWTYAKTGAGVVLKALKLTFTKRPIRSLFPSGKAWQNRRVL